jgi:hypothetical protein
MIQNHINGLINGVIAFVVLWSLDAPSWAALGVGLIICTMWTSRGTS